MFKTVLLITYAVTSVVSAEHQAPYVPYNYGSRVAGGAITDADYDPNPQYSFNYKVDDPTTGDFKAQEETRNGDVVQGRYSHIEPDGSRRTVEYVSDPASGFNAVVNKEPAAAPPTAPLGTAYRAGVAQYLPPAGLTVGANAIGYASPYASRGFAAPSLLSPAHHVGAYARGYASPYATRGFASPYLPPPTQYIGAYGSGYASPYASRGFGAASYGAPTAFHGAAYGSKHTY